MASGDRLILTRSAPLRLLTLFLFYFTQGFPVGLFLYAVPAWMAANGESTVAVAAVVGAAALPWSLKLVNGFIIDRYTFLAMGRRRSWIIGAQALIVLVLLAGAAISPAHGDVFLISAFAFAANVAVTFQDVGIDSLAVDIMAESERAKASGIMFGAQTLGIAAATALGGTLLEAYGFATCMVIAALIPAGVMLYGAAIREREGEKRLPWSAGASHPYNREIQVAAWLPLLRNALRAILAPLSLALLPVLLINAMPAGAHEAFHPGLATNLAGWSLSDYTNVISTSQLIVGLLGLAVGGWAVDAIGAQRSAIIVLLIQIAMAAAMIAARPYWTNDGVLMAYFFGGEFISTFTSITLVPIAMRLCSPAVAATQFTIYMATANFGRPLGASMAAAIAGVGSPVLMYGLIVAIYAAAVVWLLIVRFPGEDRAFADTAEVLPQGQGTPTAQN
jgi:PAT family beta-lactamase induction signal transducer AmpG